MPDDAQLPATQRPVSDLVTDQSGLPPSLRILLDEGFYSRVKQLAGVMARAEGFTPKHLFNKPEGCFAVINMALDWKLSPHFVARHTYQTPGGAIGHDGALVQSILEQSGKFVGSPIFEYHGDWSKLTGRFEKRRSDKGNEFVVRTWTDKDAVGLGVIVRWFVRGEKIARVWPGDKEPFWLIQCYPLNSPLWATDPKTQIAYLAIRRFANLTSPGILGAAAFDEDELLDASERARDVTPPPRPRREDFIEPDQSRGVAASTAEFDSANAGSSPAGAASEEPRQTWTVTLPEGELREFDDPKDASTALMEAFFGAKTIAAIDALWTDNTALTQKELPEEWRKIVSDADRDARERLTAKAQASKSPTPTETQAEREKPTTKPPAQAEDASVSLRYEIPVPTRGKYGEKDYHAWFNVLFMVKAKQQKSQTELAFLIGDNHQHTEEYKKRLSPQAAKDVQKEIDDLMQALT